MNEEETEINWPYPDGALIEITNFDGQDDHRFNGLKVRLSYKYSHVDPNLADEEQFFNCMIEPEDLEKFGEGFEGKMIGLYAREMKEVDNAPSLQQVW